jgi:hypothetical protein
MLGVFAAADPAGGLEGSGASGSGAAWANSGADQINAPNASSPDFKLHPP